MLRQANRTLWLARKTCGSRVACGPPNKVAAAAGRFLKFRIFSVSTPLPLTANTYIPRVRACDRLFSPFPRFRNGIFHCRAAIYIYSTLSTSPSGLIAFLKGSQRKCRGESPATRRQRRYRLNRDARKFSIPFRGPNLCGSPTS